MGARLGLTDTQSTVMHCCQHRGNRVGNFGAAPLAQRADDDPPSSRLTRRPSSWNFPPHPKNSPSPPACTASVELVVGIANEASVAAGCARAFSAAGAGLAATYLNEKARLARSHRCRTSPLQLASRLRCAHPRPARGGIRADRRRMGPAGLLVHAIAFAPKDDLHGRVVECSSKSPVPSSRLMAGAAPGVRSSRGTPDMTGDLRQASALESAI